MLPWEHEPSLWNRPRPVNSRSDSTLRLQTPIKFLCLSNRHWSSNLSSLHPVFSTLHSPPIWRPMLLLSCTFKFDQVSKWQYEFSAYSLPFYSLPPTFPLSLLSAFPPPLADINKLSSILTEWHHKSINLNNAKHFIPASIHPFLFSVCLSYPVIITFYWGHTSESITVLIPKQWAAIVCHRRATKDTHGASKVFQSQMISLLWLSPHPEFLLNGHS